MARQCVWEPEAAARSSGLLVQLWVVVRRSNFTDSALSGCIRLEKIEASATFRIGCCVVTRSSRQLGGIRRAAGAMMDVDMSFLWLAMGSVGLSSRKRISWISNLNVFE